ncbi:MAG: SPFH/Band 7/PHB domain protein [Leptolyngbyaceae cyanobacterium SL_1_1]|nr:SPFH/Band 7/PHB domain protein [Leptolyngbyaceae cyanobacterium RM1_1_2]NJO11955.1 SPFH/Band 7/PHB domain protein [Leptolyngbyaceae cyanobacterium SL_1_1]
MGPSILVLAFVIVGYTIGSVRIIKQGNEALVERLGRYQRKLRPGLNFIVPVVDSVVLEDTIREQLIDIEPQSAITADNVPLDVDAVVYWKILDLERTYYAIENVEEAIEELVTTTLRSAIGKMKLEETFSSRDELNKMLLDQLDEATEPWGVKVTRVEVQSIEPPQQVRDSMQLQQAAEIKKRAAITEAEGEKQAAISRAEGTVQSMRLLSEALQGATNRQQVLNFLLAQQYVESNQKLGESSNSKVVFMDPKFLSEGLVELINEPTDKVEPGNND